MRSSDRRRSGIATVSSVILMGYSRSAALQSYFFVVQIQISCENHKINNTWDVVLYSGQVCTWPVAETHLSNAACFPGNYR